MASRQFKPESSLIKVGEQTVGDGQVQIIAGPCAVEGRSLFMEVAQAVKEAGATMLRGGAFKPRTSPYSFQGLEKEGLEILAEARQITGLPVVTEVIILAWWRSGRLCRRASGGCRNMQNFTS